MDPNPPSAPPTFLASFTGVQETRVCGRGSCRQAYSDCTPDAKVLWKRVVSSRNTLGETVRWVCGSCAEHYRNKETTQRRGEKKPGINY